ncbi:hypothetical protein THMIRHAM_18740 [Thiomicrorhabdus immobilis]|uniref:F0F1 ATP synthase subunit gamma n=1 Tax=Thiomicrorhabdus immobilis TaxID=2791037 RepID=A0ABN6CZP1_9GAMM|nr:FoF1 ATP synthase subunit gamma [Thiomicrorhabdus immobilis]BCN94089.1 hypothetical protein THMIRHAM_18740 [Thiomicrorhabdus immobilis]
MAFRHDLELHRSKLQDIRSIMHSMKTLANMETHKLERRIRAQQAIAENINQMAKDFLDAYPQGLPVTPLQSALNVVLLIGSERGFCGDFNGQIWQTFQAQFDQYAEKSLKLESESSSEPQVIAIGGKLQTFLSGVVSSEPDRFSSTVRYLQGADVTEEIAHVVESIANILEAANERSQPVELVAIYHEPLKQRIITEPLLPPFKGLVEQPDSSAITSSKGRATQQPILNLNPVDFYLELTEQFVAQSIQRILTSSLMAENQSRIQHLENATRHLDKKNEELLIKSNALRQEEIIEEIEIILLNQSSA